MRFELAVPVNPTDHLLGPSHAPITLVEYGDFECPNCKQAAPAVKLLLKRFNGRVRLVWRQFPLEEVHPHALQAALASEAAAGQGEFWPMHDLLFRHQPQWAGLADPVSYFLALGDSAGLDRTRLARCVSARAARAEVDADAASSANAGASATPTFYVEKLLVSGAAPLAVFRHLLDSLYQARTGRAGAR